MFFDSELTQSKAKKLSRQRQLPEPEREAENGPVACRNKQRPSDARLGTRKRRTEAAAACSAGVSVVASVACNNLHGRDLFRNPE